MLSRAFCSDTYPCPWLPSSSQHAPFSPSSSNQPGAGDGSLPFSNLDPFAAKQMAALQATSIAKAGNRSAPGGVTSASYFGGLSTHQMPRSASNPSLEPTAGPPLLQGNSPSHNVTCSLPLFVLPVVAHSCTEHEHRATTTATVPAAQEELPPWSRQRHDTACCPIAATAHRRALPTRLRPHELALEVPRRLGHRHRSRSVGRQRC
jgi:hypothetical protein